MFSNSNHTLVKSVVLLLWLSLSGCSAKFLEQFGSESSGPKTPEQIEAERVAAEKDQLRKELAGDFAKAVEKQRAGNLDEAKADFLTILQKQPDSKSANFNLALIEKQSNNAEAFKESMNKVLAIDPSHKQALNALGTEARESGEFDKAEEYYRKALDVDPLYVPAVRNLAILLDLYRGRLTEALVLYQQAQSSLDEPDPKLKDWIFDLERRIGQSQ